MSITVQWDTDSKDAMRFVVRDNWTPEEAWDALHTAEQLLNEVDYVPDVINDLRRMGSSSMGDMSFWRRVLAWIQERNLQQTTIVLVGGGWFMQMIGRTLKGLNVPMLQRTLFATSLAEARQKLQRYRQQHPRR